MKTAVSIACLCLACGVASAEHGAHWDYSGEEGPEHWAELSPDYHDCAGKNQAPIDLTGFIQADLKPISFAYRPGGGEVINNGHTVQVSYAPGSTIEVDGHTFELKQFHFHTPSENQIREHAFPMEAHLVHADQDGRLAVVAVMIEEGAENPALAAAWGVMPEHADEEHALEPAVSAEGLLPADRDYFRFNGSLTTPPCTEGVEWLVLKQPITASKEEIERFAQVMHHPNNRPLQAVNARPVLE